LNFRSNRKQAAFDLADLHERNADRMIGVFSFSKSFAIEPITLRRQTAQSTKTSQKHERRTDSELHDSESLRFTPFHFAQRVRTEIRDRFSECLDILAIPNAPGPGYCHMADRFSNPMTRPLNDETHDDSKPER